MITENRAVHTDHPHKHEERGGDRVKDIPSKTYTYGNTKVTVHSKLVLMNKDERKNWWNEAVDHPDHPDHKTVKNICEVANRCVNSSLE